MNLSVSETAKLTGISVRTLHYYDEIGLLEPAYTSDAGYRYYDEGALSALQQILLYRELDVPLKEIKDILSMPDDNRKQALKAHKTLLQLKQERLLRLIGLVDEIVRGEQDMSFQEFDMTEIERAKEQYKEEVKRRWGQSDAYEESQKRTSSYKKEQWEVIKKEANTLTAAFADCMRAGGDPAGERAAALVKQWQAHISRWYYPCTSEILKGLGQMYVQDKRFCDNLDQFGAGTAAFMSEAIEYACGNGESFVD